HTRSDRDWSSDVCSSDLCLGSRLLSGAIDPDVARALTDADGVTLAQAYAGAGLDPAHLGRDGEALRRIGRFVELHVEQGRGLVRSEERRVGKECRCRWAA